MSKKTTTALIRKCYDIFQTSMARHRHWARVGKAIEKRTGIALENWEVKALYVAALDFDPNEVLSRSTNIDDDSYIVDVTESRVRVDESDNEITVTSEGIRTLGDLMAAAKLDPDLWYPEKVYPNYWESLRKGGGSHPHFQLKAAFKRFPDWAIGEIKPQVLPQVERSSSNTRALFIPDTQHGFRRQEDGTLLAMHDVDACALAVEVAREWKPDVIYLLGDHLDLAPWSTKFSQPASVFQTTNATLQAVHNWFAEIRRACRTAKIYYCEGNHENRIYRAIVEKLKEAEGLKTALGDRPVMSIPNLLQLDKLDIEYIAPYGVEHVLWDCVGVSHGTKHGAKVGQLLAKRLPEASYSWVQGHDHKMATGTRAIHDRGVVRHVIGLCPGTLARVDGVVPGATLHPNWSQGLGFGVLKDGEAHLWAKPILKKSIVVNGRIISCVKAPPA